MPDPTISVILPVFNRPDEAQRAVNSVRAQVGLGGADLDIIAADDASDPPLELEGCRIVRLDRNAGAGAARNAGVTASLGEILAFLDSDDVWTPEKLARQLKSLEALPELAVLASGYLYPDRGGDGSFHSRIPVAADSLDRLSSGCWSCPGSTLVLRKAVFERIGPFDETLRRLEDLDWQIRLGLAGGALHVDPVIGAIINPGSGRGLDAIARAIDHISHTFGQTGSLPLPDAAFRQLQSYLQLELAAAHHAGGRTAAAALHTLRSLWLVPRTTLQINRTWHPGPAITADQRAQIAALLT